MSADRFKSVWDSLISSLLDGNTEAAFSAELVTAVSTEIGMGFVPISICWHATNSNLIPCVALFKGAGNFVWIVVHCCSPPCEAAELAHREAPRCPRVSRVGHIRAQPSNSFAVGHGGAPRQTAYSPRFNISGSLAMFDATRLASSIVICFASMASTSVERP